MRSDFLETHSWARTQRPIYALSASPCCFPPLSGSSEPRAGDGGAGCLLLKFRDVVMGHCLENRVNRLHEHNINSSARFVATWNFEILLRSILPHNSQVIGVNFYFIPVNCENLCLENGLKSIHVMEYTSAPSKYELLICATTKTNLKIIMLSKGHQTKNVCTIWSIYRECIWYVSINIKFQKMQINPLW